MMSGKQKHWVSDAERSIMDRYCTRLAQQGDGKDGLSPADPQEIANAVDAILQGAAKVAHMNTATVAQMALGKAAGEAGVIASNAQHAALQILQLTPTLELLRDCCANLKPLKKARGPKTNHALRRMVLNLVCDWENSTGKTAKVCYDPYKGTASSPAADYICQVTEAYFGSDDERLNPLRFEVICNQIKEYKTRAGKKN